MCSALLERYTELKAISKGLENCKYFVQFDDSFKLHKGGICRTVRTDPSECVKRTGRGGGVGGRIGEPPSICGPFEINITGVTL